MNKLNREDDLEQKLQNDLSFQHILKLAPENHRKLMTFELAKYFKPIIKSLSEVYQQGYDDKTLEADHEQEEAIKSVLKEVEKEVIGEDEPDVVVEELSEGSRIVQVNPNNVLKAEQRKAIQKVRSRYE